MNRELHTSTLGGGRRGRSALTSAAALLTLSLAACDFEVVNPGPIQDQDLDAAGAHASTVNGAMRGVLRGLSEYALSGGAVSRDHIAASHTGWAGTSLLIELGQFNKNQTETTGWNDANNGRWIGEHMAARIRQSQGAQAESYNQVGRFLLWGALGNRVLGEHSCTAVFEGEAPKPWLAYFERAAAMFEDAAAVAGRANDQTTRVAAIGGAASAYLYLGNWAKAIEMASQVPENFRFSAQYTTSHPDFFWPHDAAQNGFRALTFWSHPFEDYFPASGDPRAAWGFDVRAETQVPRPTWGQKIPMYYPLKTMAPRNKPAELTTYAPNTNAIHVKPVNLVTGREMLLVRAEAILASGGNVADAMTLINRVRTTAFDRDTNQVGSYFTGQPLAPLTAATREEAWTHLKFERMLELNLEGRRFGDRKRWAHYKSPGNLNPKELLPDFFVTRWNVPKTPNVCFPLPEQEIDRNANIPSDFQDVIISG
jgi:hypothetical protein